MSAARLLNTDESQVLEIASLNFADIIWLLYFYRSLLKMTTNAMLVDTIVGGPSMSGWHTRTRILTLESFVPKNTKTTIVSTFSNACVVCL